MQLQDYATDVNGNPICGAYTYKFGKWEIDVDVNDKLDFSQDLTAWLTKQGDNVASVLMVVDPKLTIGNVSHDAAHVTAWIDAITGAKKGELLQMTYRVTTDNTPPRTKDFSIYLRVVEG